MRAPSRYLRRRSPGFVPVWADRTSNIRQPPSVDGPLEPAVVTPPAVRSARGASPAGALHAPPGRRRANLHRFRSAPRSMASNQDRPRTSPDVSVRHVNRADSNSLNPTPAAWSGRLTFVEADRPLGTRPARPGPPGESGTVQSAARDSAAAPFAGLVPRRQNIH